MQVVDGMGCGKKEKKQIGWIVGTCVEKGRGRKVRSPDLGAALAHKREFLDAAGWGVALVLACVH